MTATIAWASENLALTEIDGQVQLHPPVVGFQELDLDDLPWGVKVQSCGE